MAGSLACWAALGSAAWSPAYDGIVAPDATPEDRSR
jgi:hypothetical protein